MQTLTVAQQSNIHTAIESPTFADITHTKFESAFTFHVAVCRLISNSKHIRSASIVSNVPCAVAVHRFHTEINP